MVFWICKQIERAAMRSKDVADEQKRIILSFLLKLFRLSNETCFPLLYNTLVSAFHLVIQEGVVDECVCLLWNLHKHIEH